MKIHPFHAAPNLARTVADWESIERDYRVGVLSIREVGKLHGVSEGAIRKKAKALGWERDLTDRVNEKVRTELVRSTHLPDPKSPAYQKQTEREIIDQAAATVVQVVREHRGRIKQGNALVELLSKQLMDVAGRREELEQAIGIVCAEDKTPERMNRLMKAVSLGAHSTIAVNLANATRVWVGLERQAFNISEGVDPDGKGNGLIMEQIAADPRSRLTFNKP
ncbi:hypothetical protein LP416_29345 [Polaromonas sp. P2-4]|nr:hypothetical protein LP416_29345 [Polaromonas sp. P2-4]